MRNGRLSLFPSMPRPPLSWSDRGGALEIRGESSLNRPGDHWALAGVPSGRPSLSWLPWERFRVLNIVPSERKSNKIECRGAGAVEELLGMLPS